MALSNRETTIAERYATGQTHKEIAAALHIAPATVRNHLAAIYRKLEVANKPELIRALSTRAPSAPILRNLAEGGPPHREGASIAVMPFANIGDAAGEVFCQGVVADIQHELTRCPDLLVAGRGSCLALGAQAVEAGQVARRLGVQYLLEGSLRSEHDRVRLTAELVDGASGMVIWSERFDGRLGDILAIEAEVAQAITANLALQIDQAQFERRCSLTVDQLTAYDWRLRGNRHLELGGRDNLNRAKDCFTRALALEPGSSPALAGLSMSFGYACDLLMTEAYDETLARHLELAEQAVAADESDSRGHYAISCALMLSGRFEQADRHAQRGLELNPSEYHNLCNRGYSLMALGRIEESLGCFDQSLRRNPLAPNSCLMALGLIEYLEANYGPAATALSRMTAAYPQKASTRAAACAQAGERDLARQAAREFEVLSAQVPLCPNAGANGAWRGFWRQAYPYLKEEPFERVLEGLAKADLPV
ncbi:MAG: LuxR C-terminal-related transcriptional regulator [Pseudomonadota bacterium]